MIEVIKLSEVPTAEIECGNCRSILRYGNRDLDKRYRENTLDRTFLGSFYYTFRCPVCGVIVEAPWIKNKELNNPQT